MNSDVSNGRSLHWAGPRTPHYAAASQPVSNKGEARNTLTKAVYFHRLGEIRDRSIEDLRNRASGLTLRTAAIVLWNTVYLERSITALKNDANPSAPAYLKHLSPLGWDHINLSGDYTWLTTTPGKYPPVRRPNTKYR